tara:strand:+ start:26 stop:661 length:636 start_codon:yes stop_codon:yes gene_type:complete
MNIQDGQTIILFGGSFDPPHVGHVALPVAARSAIDAKWLAFVPAARAPHKLDKVQTDPTHRLAMLQLAIEDIEDAIVLTDELDRAADGAPSYTVDTLEHLRDQLPEGVTMRLLIGADQVRIFDQWREPERIIELAEPLVMVRPPDTKASLLASLPDDDARKAWENRLVDVPAMDISSTQIRQRVAQGESTEGMVCPAVQAYILEHGLYRAV